MGLRDNNNHRDENNQMHGDRDSFIGMENGRYDDMSNHKLDDVAINLKEMESNGADKKLFDESVDDPLYDDFDDEDEVDEEEEKKSNIVSSFVFLVQTFFIMSCRRIDQLTRGYLIRVILLIAYFVYVIFAILHKSEGEDFWRLIGITIFGILIATRHHIKALLHRLFVKVYGADKLLPRAKRRAQLVRYFGRWFGYAILVAVIFYVMYSAGRQDINKLRSVPGLIIIILICLFLSSNPKQINWHTIFVSVGLQFVCAMIFLKWAFGRSVLAWIQDRINEFFSNSESGSKFLFGETYKDHYIVFGALPIVLIMGATMSILYYLGAMQMVVKSVGSFLSFFLDTGPVESTSVAAGIFLEGIMAILSLKPFLMSLTKSELFVVVTSAFASLGGAYLGVLVSMQVPLEHLFTAMMISAPATFTVCKLIFPETKKRKGKQGLVFEATEEDSNMLEALQNGSTSMVPLLANVAATFFVFMAAISWVDNTIMWFGERVGLEQLTMSKIFSYLLYPIPLAMGIEPVDCLPVAKLWGYRITSTNIVAFFKMLDMRRNRMMLEQYQLATNFSGSVTYHSSESFTLDLWNQTLEGGVMSARSEAILTYSLCGFSGIVSVGISIGIFYTLLPARKKWIATIPLQALIAGNIANMMSGCLASFFY